MSVQGLPVKAPVPEVVKLTVPVGVVGLPEVSVTVAVQLVPTPTRTLGELQLTEVLVGTFAAVTYGPPSPTGGAPAGTMPSVEVSVIAIARLSRPLPVSLVAATGSALRASRPMMTSLEAFGSFA